MSDTLIQCIEKATEGSRGLSDRFLLAMGWTNWRQVDWRDPNGVEYTHSNRLDPTRNLQHTMEAVPEGWSGSIHFEWRGTATPNPRKLCTASICSPGARYETVGPNQGGDYHQELIAGTDGHGIQMPTEALALSAAILRSQDTE